jgi:hypothetical protein
MRPPPRSLRGLAALGFIALLALFVAAPVAAHESRHVGPFDFSVGMIDEPVHVGQQSGLELTVKRDGQPVADVDSSLKAEVSFGDKSMPLELLPSRTGDGYEATFIPTAAGPYAFHLVGTIDGVAIDERFASSPTTFEEVVDVPAGEFPVGLPTLTQLAAEAKKGADAAALVPVALGVAGLGLLVGLVGIGIALAAHRRKPEET